ncbi:MAG TPA: acetyl-CoA decarbonylase/synthase complex subunit gamma [Candidatus Angelobacter sp.]|nr:acetyl-CoA decarbonylase/synthase complex subunit gamma [Candidatus Angelobacter sp.]
MAMTGLQIFKLLPKTNCGECGVPTCMAFAMKLAAKNAELAACPYASDEAKTTIGAASKPPIQLVKIGPPESEVLIGNETVMFRHDKTFVHQSAVAIAFADNDPLSELGHKIAEVRDYCLERVGEQLRINLVLVDNFSEEVRPFVDLVKTAAGSTGLGIILRSTNLDALEAGLKELQGKRPLIHAATPANADAVAALALKYGAPLVARAATLDELIALTTRLAGLGIKEIVLDLPADNPAAALQYNTLIRKAALKNSFVPLGYPIINFVNELDDAATVADATTYLCKYGSIVVLDRMKLELLLPLMMLRQNIYTDPQKPIQVDPKVYPIGEPGKDSPVLVTTNFSLTYFLVSGEIENSGVPANLVVVDTEGMSVLTGWAAGKLSGEKVGAAVKASGLQEQLGRKRIVLPGYVSQISGEVEEALPGWEVLVGPGESSDLASFLKLQAAK